MKPEVRRWFERADEDLQQAAANLAQRHLPGLAAFHLQQAIEKACKAFLIERLNTLRRIHNLNRLLVLARELEVDLVKYRDLCKTLNPAYIEERYPDTVDRFFDLERIESLLPQVSEMLEDLRDRCDGMAPDD